MGARGRSAGAGLAVVQYEGPRQTPPVELTDRQLEVWNRIVEGLPADWFRTEQLDLLVQYCRHIDRAGQLAVVLDEWERMPLEPVNKGKYIELLQMELAETKAIVDLATRMRITHQSTYDKSKRKLQSSAKLWEG